MKGKQIATRVAVAAGALTVVLAAVLLIFRPEGLLDGAREFGRGEYAFRDGWEGASPMSAPGRGFYHSGWRRFGFGLFWPLVLGLIVIAGFRGAMRRRFWKHPDRDGESGIDLLDRMFAEGEMSEEEYLARREVLRRGEGDSKESRDEGGRS